MTGSVSLLADVCTKQEGIGADPVSQPPNQGFTPASSNQISSLKVLSNFRTRTFSFQAITYLLARAHN